MGEMDERLTALRSAQQQATQVRMRAEMELDGAKASLANAKAALESIGVRSVEEAEEMVAKWEEELSVLVAEAEMRIEESRA